MRYVVMVSSVDGSILVANGWKNRIVRHTDTVWDTEAEANDRASHLNTSNPPHALPRGCTPSGVVAVEDDQPNPYNVTFV